MADEAGMGGEGAEATARAGHPAAGGFAAGLVVGVLLGAGIALLFAPERGSRTRSQLSRRLRRLREEAADELERTGGRTRRDLRRRRERLQARLEQAAGRARDRFS